MGVGKEPVWHPLISPETLIDVDVHDHVCFPFVTPRVFCHGPTRLRSLNAFVTRVKCQTDSVAHGNHSIETRFQLQTFIPIIHKLLQEIDILQKFDSDNR